jgi:hypothetical protein
MERGSRKRSSSAGSEKMERESWWQIGKNGRTLFDRPKLTVGCSANGRGGGRGRRRRMKLYTFRTVPLSIMSFALYTRQWYVSETCRVLFQK